MAFVVEDPCIFHEAQLKGEEAQCQPASQLVHCNSINAQASLRTPSSPTKWIPNSNYYGYSCPVFGKNIAYFDVKAFRFGLKVVQMSPGLNPQAAGVVACATITVGLAAVVILLRFITRTRILHFVGKDDWCIAIALLFSIGNTVGMIVQADLGLGQHISDIPPPQIIKFYKGYYFTVLSYRISLILTKISILLLYIRVFKTSRIRYACYMVLGAVILYGTWLVLEGVIPCVPIGLYWDKSIRGHCLPNEPVWFTNSGLNIVTDIAIFMLPLRVISQLSLPKRQKLGLLFVFALGFLVCIISILRIYSLRIAAASKDPTFDNIGIANWSNIELNTAIICPSLTTLKPLISRLFPRMLSTGGAPVYNHFSTGVDIESNKSAGVYEIETLDISKTDSRCSVGSVGKDDVLVKEIEDVPVVPKAKTRSVELRDLPA